MKHKALLVIGKMWIVFGLSIIFLGYFQAYSDGGWSEVLQKFQNYDLRKLIGVIITLAPGFIFLRWAKKYEN